MATYSGSDKRLQYLFQHGGGGSLEDLDDVEITNPSDGDALVYDGEEEKWVNGEGGGGNANEQVLTKAEYDALTEEQKMNNTTYYINDADTWTSKEVQPVIYSTDEREIGVWLDGKPLYQKTVKFTLGASGSYQSYSTGIMGVDYAFVREGVVELSATSKFGVSAYSGGTYIDANDCKIYATLSSNEILFDYRVGATVAGKIAKVTVCYTKTTDQAGSGIYTPQGQLAVHYSTDEHVIGTWIDGKTLYEKTLEFNNLAVAVNDWTNLNAGLSNIRQMVSTKSYYNWGNTRWSDASAYFRLMYDNQNLYYYTTNITSGVINAYVTIQYTKTTD